MQSYRFSTKQPNKKVSKYILNKKSNTTNDITGKRRRYRPAFALPSLYLRSKSAHRDYRMMGLGTDLQRTWNGIRTELHRRKKRVNKKIDWDFSYEYSIRIHFSAKIFG